MRHHPNKSYHKSSIKRHLFKTRDFGCEAYLRAALIQKTIFWTWKCCFLNVASLTQNINALVIFITNYFTGKVLLVVAARFTCKMKKTTSSQYTLPRISQEILQYLSNIVYREENCPFIWQWNIYLCSNFIVLYLVASNKRPI